MSSGPLARRPGVVGPRRERIWKMEGSANAEADYDHYAREHRHHEDRWSLPPQRLPPLGGRRSSGHQQDVEPLYHMLSRRAMTCPV